MVFRVALIGHSQLPSIPDYDDVSFTEFKSRGAHISHLSDPNRFNVNAIRNNQWDCIILFLGGNDLCVSRNPNKVENDLETLINSFNANLILVTEIESRVYEPRFRRRFRITTEEYNGLARAVNRKLKRRARHWRQGVRLIHCPPSYNIAGRDGIHFGDLGTLSLINKYKGAIRHARNNQ